jgi:hypothetical protein
MSGVLFLSSGLGIQFLRVPRPCRVLCDRAGIFDFGMQFRGSRFTDDEYEIQLPRPVSAEIAEARAGHPQ